MKYAITWIGETPDTKENWELCEDHQTGVSIWECPDPKDRFYCTATAASITGWVRAYLLTALHNVVSPVYCDTDSIICQSVGSLRIGNEIGEWKVENEYDEIHIAKRKMYTGKVKNTDHWKNVSAGVSFSSSEIKNVTAGNTVTYLPHAPTFSIKSSAKFIKRTVSR